MKFQVNDIVRVVGKRCGHGFNIGDITYVIEEVKFTGFKLAYINENMERPFVVESEIIKIGRVIKFKE